MLQEKKAQTINLSLKGFGGFVIKKAIGILSQSSPVLLEADKKALSYSPLNEAKLHRVCTALMPGIFDTRSTKRNIAQTTESWFDPRSRKVEKITEALALLLRIFPDTRDALKNALFDPMYGLPITDSVKQNETLKPRFSEPEFFDRTSTDTIFIAEEGMINQQVFVRFDTNSMFNNPKIVEKNSDKDTFAIDNKSPQNLQERADELGRIHRELQSLYNSPSYPNFVPDQQIIVGRALFYDREAITIVQNY